MNKFVCRFQLKEKLVAHNRRQSVYFQLEGWEGGLGVGRIITIPTRNSEFFLWTRPSMLNIEGPGETKLTVSLGASH